ncbi:MAG: translation initiation factor IF-2 N-terminal domain-containing protein, partial [Oscillibacter sp.]|nr:translation initiation factor IF-2 N-terminal domain-containing protein [Oscillibacter sp.]
MAIDKYRVHEVAKDFGLSTKTITEILTKYVAAPKNHMQVLTDHELSVIFDYLTQHNQISGIQVIYADVEQAKPAPAAEQPKPAAPQQQAAKPAQHQGAQQRPQQQGNRPQQGGKPAQQQGNRPQQAAKPAQQAAPAQNVVVQQPVSRVPQKKIVDTRKGGDVNLDKYDERLEDLGGQRGERMAQKGGKEKFRNNNKNKGGMTFSNKRKQDEAEKMRKLQLEIAKKAPVKVQIPDEISVGELASR